MAWAPSHYLKQCWLRKMRIYASSGLNELKVGISWKYITRGTITEVAKTFELSPRQLRVWWKSGRFSPDSNIILRKIFQFPSIYLLVQRSEFSMSNYSRWVKKQFSASGFSLLCVQWTSEKKKMQHNCIFNAISKSEQLYCKKLQNSETPFWWLFKQILFMNSDWWRQIMWFAQKSTLTLPHQVLMLEPQIVTSEQPTRFPHATENLVKSWQVSKHTRLTMLTVSARESWISPDITVRLPVDIWL